MYDSTGPLKFATINENTAASNVIVAAVAGKKIRLLGLVLISAAAVTVTIEDQDGNDLLGPVDVDIKGGFVLPTSGIGYQETPVGKSLNMLLGGAVQVGGSITYQEIL